MSLTDLHSPGSSWGPGARIRFARDASVDLAVVKVTEEGPLGLRAANALLGAAPASHRSALDDERRSVLARALIARLVAIRTGVDPSLVEHGRDARGRPFLVRSDLHVSIAHSGEFVACAVSGCRVGVDIERTDRPEVDGALARRVCSPAELAQLGECNAPAVIRLWARKEAVAKALGFGLGVRFEQLDVSAVAPLIAGQPASTMTVRDIIGGPRGYVLAIATEQWCRVRARLVVECSESPLHTRPHRRSG